MGPDHVGQRLAQHDGQRAVGPPHPPGLVHHREAFGQGVERRLPLLLAAPDEVEEATVGERDRRVGSDRREQPDVVGGERAPARLGDHEGAHHDAVGAQRDGGGGFDRGAAAQRGARLAVADQLEPLAARRARDQAGIVGRDRGALQLGERPFGRGDGERIVRVLARQGHQRAAGVDEAHGVAYDLLHDALELDGLREHVRQLLQPEQLRQPPVQLVGGALPVALQAPLALPGTAEHPHRGRAGRAGGDQGQGERNGCHDN